MLFFFLFKTPMNGDYTCFACRTKLDTKSPIVVFFKKKPNEPNFDIYSPSNLVFVHLCENCDEDEVVYETVQKKFALCLSIETKKEINVCCFLKFMYA